MAGERASVAQCRRTGEPTANRTFIAAPGFDAAVIWLGSAVPAAAAPSVASCVAAVTSRMVSPKRIAFA
jgi:hypothetical protein